MQRSGSIRARRVGASAIATLGTVAVLGRAAGPPGRTRRRPPRHRRTAGAGHRRAAADARRRAEDVPPPAGLSSRARRQRAARRRPGVDGHGPRRPPVGGRDARLHADLRGQGRGRPGRAGRRARGHRRRRPRRQAHRLPRRAGPAAHREGARSRRARHRAAAADPGARHQRRSEGRHPRGAAQRRRRQGRQPRAQPEQPAVGPRQLALHLRVRHRLPLDAQRAREREDAVARAVGHLDGRHRADLPQLERRSAARRLPARPGCSRATRRRCGRAASTSR